MCAVPYRGRNPIRATLPANGFLKDLHREMRRSERSNAALSLALYHVDAMHSPHVERLLDALYGAKRETDIVGHIGDNLIAVLCTDTGEQGIRSFVGKIDARSGGLPFVPVAATYPDDIFQSLTNGSVMQSTVDPLLASDAAGEAARGYALKRCLDIVGAALALCLLSPLMLAVACAIALSSKGPVIFRQTRLGKGGRPFTFYKFRSMRTDSDDRLHREFVSGLIRGGQAAGGAGAPYKLGTDPRTTPIGRLIRKTSIDELPQFFNVLKGDMSLVGPRPPIPYETQHYQSWHLRRILSIKPGITGLWQVDGRSRVTFNEMVRMDLRYIHDCSLLLDLRILVKTVFVVIRCTGAA
jgi:lipopolysaccharide/colanic/teichoic acid biosynthesis glycosyltransferase